MQRTFKMDNGKEIAPEFFAVYHRKDGSTFLKVQDEISEYDFDKYDNVKRIELFKNGTENLSPEQIARLDKQ